jgi:hypothetical protein
VNAALQRLLGFRHSFRHAYTVKADGRRCKEPGPFAWLTD